MKCHRDYGWTWAMLLECRSVSWFHVCYISAWESLQLHIRTTGLIIVTIDQARIALPSSLMRTDDMEPDKLTASEPCST